MRFSEYYGFNASLCWPYRPQTKGEMENTIKYVKGNFFNGRTFESLPDLNSQCSAWLRKVNSQIHGTAGKILAEIVGEETLARIDDVPEFTNRITWTRKVFGKCYVHYNTKRYSVPWKYARRESIVTEERGILKIMIGDEIIDGYLESAKDKPFIEVLGHLLEQETGNMKFRKVEMKLKYSGIPFQKTLDQFDFSFQSSIDRKVGDDLVTMRFIHGNENVVFLGPPVSVETHLSVAVGIQAACSDIPVYYVPAIRLVKAMKKDPESSKLQYRLATYARFPLMIVNEIGYLLLTMEELNLFFQFVFSRYEKSSTIYTSNKSFSEWVEVQGDNVMASAVPDRILHHCTVVNISGDSYRLKERKKMGNMNMSEVK